MCDKRLCSCKKRSLSSEIDPKTLQELENRFANFLTTKSTSLLKKHLSRSTFDRVKTLKSNYGSTLLEVIQSGLANPDSGVGLYAPDPDSYRVFSDLFDPVIEDYHSGFKPSDLHPSLNWGNTKDLGDLDPEGKYIVSTRVRCGRSLEGYPFNPTMTDSHYYEIQNKVRDALESMTGELKGRYYPLEGMDSTTQQRLVDEHFLFKEGDRFLQAANAYRFWPTGRGIFFNEVRTFLVWCNEEDHMRIISMQSGGNLAQVYGRLVNAVEQIERKIPFSRHERLGFLTFCPTNLGTTIRASVHIKVPNLSVDYTKFEQFAATYNLQVRGTRGEHTEGTGGIYDISNKRRLGLTEFEALQEMKTGVLAIIQQEVNLESIERS
ncbi:arginine kinase [Orussus abietinus]|uniref:arginine kinase n=1 Tax=Orussus abietinus TaxID=222816 RepID=UPI0006261855|nr:arginine kinase [Orussus abietinus]